MNKTQVMALLDSQAGDGGPHRPSSEHAGSDTLTRLGIGLTTLRKLARQVGRDHHLAAELWQSDVYEARVISLLIDDPKRITREQAEQQVEQLDQGQLEHVFCSCGGPLTRTPFVAELARDWVESTDPCRRSCGYGLVYELSKSKKKSAPDEAFFLAHIRRMDASFDAEPPSVQMSMGCALMGIGKRTPSLNAAALAVARRLGPIEVETDGGRCEPFDVVKHLTSDYIRARLGV